MRNKTFQAYSEGQVVRRQKRQRRRANKLVEPYLFSELHQGGFQMKIVKGIAYCRFISGDKNSLGIGSNLMNAYRKCIRAYNERYEYAGV